MITISRSLSSVHLRLLICDHVIHLDAGNVVADSVEIFFTAVGF